MVEQIVRIAESHDIMSLRGTAFFVLGLISRSTHGLEILSEQGWDSNTSPAGSSLGFCLPTDLGKLFSFQPWKSEPVTTIDLAPRQRTSPDPPPQLPLDRQPFEPEELPMLEYSTDDQVDARIFELVVQLGNRVLYKRAYAELKKIRNRGAPGLQSPSLFRQVMALMERNHYRLPARKLVRDLFDRHVLRQVVFDEDAEPGSDSADNDSGEERTERQRSISDPANFSRPIG